MVQMYLLITMKNPGCSGFGAVSQRETLALCEEGLVDGYVTGLESQNDRRIWAADYVLAIPVPDSGILDLASLDILSDPGVLYISLS